MTNLCESGNFLHLAIGPSTFQDNWIVRLLKNKGEVEGPAFLGLLPDQYPAVRRSCRLFSVFFVILLSAETTGQKRVQNVFPHGLPISTMLFAHSTALNHSIQTSESVCFSRYDS
jgi:hypothetical protein